MSHAGPEWLSLAAIALAALSGAPGLAFSRESRAGERIAVVTLALACGGGIAAAAWALIAPTPGLVLHWAVPGGAIAVGIDAISAMFLLQIFVIALLGAIYGLGYWPQSAHPTNGRKLRLFYGSMTAGLALVVVARNSLLFLMGWEIMALAAFFLVSTEDEQASVRQAGYVYVVATRVGTLCLFAAFALLHSAIGSFDLIAPPPTRLASAIFLLGVAGFGVKAGLMPLHVWLPGAHANAPSHVSAFMSGVLIKIGIYGLIRMSSLFAHAPLWWGATVLVLGVVSAVLGVAFAIGQHDVKRLLAYHSVENIGIIAIGIGVAMLGRASGRTDWVVLGLAGALLHTWNHGLFKALLFFSAGSVVHATGTREIDRLGGLARAMPSTALYFLVGAVAICGLPPLNGLVSEFLVYLGLLRSAASGAGRLWLAGALATPSLALVGALAVACFVKVFGAVFLGQPRSDAARHAHESPRTMLFPMLVLATLCVCIGLRAPLFAPVLDEAVSAWAPELVGVRAPLLSLAPLVWISGAAVSLIVLGVAGAVVLRGLVRGKSAPVDVGTWDCGYARPTTRMQYTSSSFAETIVGLFAWVLRPSEHAPKLRAVFPSHASYHSHVPEVVLDNLLVPAANGVGRGFQWMRWIQRGSTQRYVLYILITLVVLFAWRRS